MAHPSTPSTPGRRPQRLQLFAAALRDLASRQDVDETLQYTVDLSSELINGCDIADLMFLGRGGTTTPVSTDDRAIALDRLQDETGEGPCRDAALRNPIVLSGDLAQDERWPAFGHKADQLGVRSALAFQLFLNRNDGDRLGALNLYGLERNAFNEHAVDLGDVFAAHCATVLASAIAQEGAATALESRDLIGQAKGILMERHQVPAAEAFDILRRCSQDRNIKLREVAEHVAATGRLP